MGVLGAAERRREQIRDRREKDPVFRGQGPAGPRGHCAECLTSGKQRCGNDTVAGDTIVETEQFFDGSGGRVVVRDSPSAPKPVDAAQPEAGVSAV